MPTAQWGNATPQGTISLVICHRGVQNLVGYLITVTPLAFLGKLASMVWESIGDIVLELLVFVVLFGLLAKVLKSNAFLVLVCYRSDFHQRVLWVVVNVAFS